MAALVAQSENSWIYGSIVIATVAATGIIITLLRYFFIFARWQGKVDTDRKNFIDFMQEVRNDIKEILGRLELKPYGPSSPIQLTDLGKRIANDLSIEDWASGLAQDLRENIVGKEEFEIFGLCVKEVNDQWKENESFNLMLRVGAYNHGITDEQMRNVYAIVLRDVLMVSNPP